MYLLPMIRNFGSLATPDEAFTTGHGPGCSHSFLSRVSLAADLISSSPPPSPSPSFPAYGMQWSRRSGFSSCCCSPAVGALLFFCSSCWPLIYFHRRWLSCTAIGVLGGGIGSDHCHLGWWQFTIFPYFFFSLLAAMAFLLLVSWDVHKCCLIDQLVGETHFVANLPRKQYPN